MSKVIQKSKMISHFACRDLEKNFLENADSYLAMPKRLGSESA